MNLAKQPGESWDAYNARAKLERDRIGADFAAKLRELRELYHWTASDPQPEWNRECALELQDPEGRRFTISLDAVNMGRVSVAAVWPSWTDNTGGRHVYRPSDLGWKSTPHITLHFGKDAATIGRDIISRFMPEFSTAYDACALAAAKREGCAKAALEQAQRIADEVGGEVRPNLSGATLYPPAGPRCDFLNWDTATVRFEVFSTDPDTALAILHLLKKAADAAR